MKKMILSGMLLCAALTASALDTPLWLRYPAISPDGKTVAFNYKGDIYCVDANGGQARQLTSNAAYDYHAIWSPDGQKIAFASDRKGSMDVYVVDAKGGIPKRLTTGSASEIPVAWKDNGHVLFASNIMPTAESIVFPQGIQPQIYEVDIEGRRPEMFSTITLEDISINSRGELLYHDKKGYEDTWRKHHTSSIARDIWLLKDGRYQKLTDFAGEDRNPVWAADEQSFYYLSEQGGSFNIYKRGINATTATQITNHKDNPVRFLTSSTDGILCYSYDGEIYTVKEGYAPKRLSVSIVADSDDNLLTRQIMKNGATEISLSPDGKEIAFVMHGDVYVTSVEYKTTKQITNTPGQERSIDFAPDGRSIVYSAERNGVWQIYQTSIKKKDEKKFTYATELEEERLTDTDHTSLQPKYSPDGKSIAFYEDRSALKVMCLKNKKTHTVLNGKYNFSYSDGDIWFEWSPDNRWLLASYIGTGGWNNSDVALVSAGTDNKVYNLTNSGYSESSAKWVLGGKAIIFTSDRAGYRSHGSWGAEDDIYIMFFDLDAYERFRMTKEEKELADKESGEAKKKKEEAEKEKKNEENDKIEVKKVEPLELDIENSRDRIIRLTDRSTRIGDMLLSPDGETLYYQAAYEKGYDLWKLDLIKQSSSRVTKGLSGAIIPDKDCKNIYVCSNTIKKVKLDNGTTEPIEFEAWFNYRPYDERRYLFDHIWRQVDDKFYIEDMHGVDWKAYRSTYEKFLPHISNNYDFGEMLSEMLGELNASHTGARFYPSGAAMQTASLGLFFDHTYSGDGLKVKEVINRGPFAVRKSGVTAGCIIESIDGTTITADTDINSLLDGKAGKPVRVGVRCKSKHFETTVKPVTQSQLNELLYKRWVDRNRAFVDSISGGRIAYIHVKAMNSQSFRTVYEELLSDRNRNRDAVVVDERHNGGGWLHDDLCTLLSGKEYQQFVPHGKYVGSDPFNKWTKPSCVLICEDDYSNGHGFPWVYKELNIGKLIGAPVPGTMTAVWWETLMDRSLVFGIPQVGCRSMNGVFGENTQLNPDIEVYNTPEDIRDGYDRQLERAVREMMK